MVFDEPDPLDFEEYLDQMDSERKKMLEDVALSLRAKIELETAREYYGQGFRSGLKLGIAGTTFVLTFVPFLVILVLYYGFNWSLT